MINVLTKLFKKDKKLVPMKYKYNVGKCFGTIRLKSGESVITNIYEGYITHWDETVTGRKAFEMRFINQINDPINNSIYISSVNRYIKISDIIDITITELDHEIEYYRF